jgi:hypothetical protein
MTERERKVLKKALELSKTMKRLVENNLYPSRDSNRISTIRQMHFLHHRKQHCPYYKHQYVRFEVFTAVTMKNCVFWDVTPCGSCKNRHFGGI